MCTYSAARLTNHKTDALVNTFVPLMVLSTGGPRIDVKLS